MTINTPNINAMNEDQLRLRAMLFVRREAGTLPATLVDDEIRYSVAEDDMAALLCQFCMDNGKVAD